MVDVEKLRERMVNKKLSVSEISQLIGVNPSTMYRKLAAAEKITVGEAVKIVEALELTQKEAEQIFFAK